MGCLYKFTGYICNVRNELLLWADITRVIINSCMQLNVRQKSYSE